tara:strand:+ start:838 stop:1533 length:696 start_codon:yes stop_codon:yes gene_type:complete
MKEIYFYSYGGSGLKYITNKVQKKLLNNSAKSALANEKTVKFITDYQKNHNPHLFADKQPQLRQNPHRGLVQDEEFKEYQNKAGILIYANPIDAFLSFWRRSGESNNWINSHGKTLTGNTQLSIKELNIKDWLVNNDSFNLLETWFDSYLNLDPKIDILFVKYESLSSGYTQKSINQITQLDLDFEDLEKRNDSRKILKVSSEEINKLSYVFKDLIDKQSRLPDVILKRGV